MTVVTSDSSNHQQRRGRFIEPQLRRGVGKLAAYLAVDAGVVVVEPLQLGGAIVAVHDPPASVALRAGLDFGERVRVFEFVERVAVEMTWVVESERRFGSGHMLAGRAMARFAAHVDFRERRVVVVLGDVELL